MKLTSKEREAVAILRELDAQQRDRILVEMRRVALASRITARAAQVTQVTTLPAHRIISAFGATPKPTRPLSMLIGALLLVGCATPTTGVVSIGGGNYTITRQGSSAMTATADLRAAALKEAEDYCRAR